MEIIKIGKNQIEREIERNKRIEERRNCMLEIVKHPIKCMICETVIKADPKDITIIGDGHEYHEEYIKCPNCDNHIAFSDIK